MSPSTLWSWSSGLHRRGLTPLARLLKLLNFVLFKAVLPYECEVGEGVYLLHRGVGTVLHPNTRVGRGVGLSQGVTVGVQGAGGRDGTVVLEDDVFVGAGACIIVAAGRTLTVGAGARIGANAVVVRDVPAGAVMAAPLATALQVRPEAG